MKEADMSELSMGGVMGAMQQELEQLRAENERLRKLFDDAGQGEHNVLALVDYYQELAIAAGNREQRLRALLASGQCVDLASVSEQAFGSLIQRDGQSIDEALKEAKDIRQWLIEDSGVKL